MSQLESNSQAEISIIQNPQIATNTGTKCVIEVNRPMYALYRYQTTSLSIVVSSMNLEHEAELRKLIAKKLSKGSIYTSHGSISPLELSSADTEDAECRQCYYCMLRQGGTTETSDVTATYCSIEFILCLVAPANTALDVFKPELDIYSNKVKLQLEAELVEVEDNIQSCLQDWYEETIHYLCECVKLLNNDIKYLLDAALLDNAVEIQCNDLTTKHHLQSFVEVCGLSGFTSRQVKMHHSNIMLKIIPDGHEFLVKESSEFCEKWAATLISGDTDNPVFIRQVIENFRLKVIQDLNTFKRLLIQAEADFYDLFRCLTFLRNSGNVRLLLKLAQLDIDSCEHSTSHSVLPAIHAYLEQYSKWSS